MGLKGAGEAYLAVLSEDDRFDLMAVADSDLDVLRRRTEGCRMRAYEDYRSLVVETGRLGVDLIFVALEPFQAIEFVRLAADRGIGIFHKAPFARNMVEARALIDRFAAASRPFVVSRPWQFDPAYGMLLGLAKNRSRVHVASAEVRVAQTAEGWRGDSRRAGGGVLLNGAYDAVDLITKLMGTPEAVYAQCSSVLPPGTARNYDTEDGAVLSMRFAGDRIGTLAAWRGATRPVWTVRLVGAEQVIEARHDGVTVTADQDEASPWLETPGGPAGAIRALATAMLGPTTQAPSLASDHLPTMAVIEAAYLSAKTGAPESPARFLG